MKYQRINNKIISIPEGNYLYWIGEDGFVYDNQEDAVTYIITSQECPCKNYYKWVEGAWVCDETCELECKRQAKLDELSNTYENANDGRIMFTHNYDTYYIKANETTKKEASLKWVDVDGKTEWTEADLSWFADWNDEIKIPTKVIFSNVDIAKAFYNAIGNYFQGVIQVYLQNKYVIMSLETIEEVEAFDIDSIEWTDRNIGEFN